MDLFEELDRKAEALSRMGERVRAEARATNTPICYMEPAYGTDIIWEFPDGSRERRTADGSAVAIAPRGQ